jgi:type II secretory ATPase GspE/PulE/Tfp pilus assembly ATPase PilB-like protein
MKRIIKKLRFKHQDDQALPQAQESDIALIDLFDIDEETFTKEYELTTFDSEKKHIQDYLFAHDLYLIEKKENSKKTVLALSIDHIDLNSLIDLVDFDEIRLASQKTMNIFLKNQNTIGKAVNETVGAEAFIKELLEKAALTFVSDIYIRLLGLSVKVEYSKNDVMKLVAHFGIKEAVLIRNALATLAKREVTEMEYHSIINLNNRRYRIQFFEANNGNYDATLRVYSSEFGDNPNLEKLDYLPEEIIALRNIARYKYGLFLMVAQTGQGKTTTQNAIQEELADLGIVVREIADPVEIESKKVTQIDVSRYSSADGKFKYTTERALRDVLRAAPKAINIGEVGNAEEMKNAYKAASTGHFVLATMHANSVAIAVDRLAKEMGLSEYDLKSILRGIVYQQLTKKLCPHCRVQVSEKEYRASQEGCSKCADHTPGYLGRTPVAEIAHFKFHGDYDLRDPKTYEYYRSLKESANQKLELGYIDALHKEAVIKGKADPIVKVAKNGN